MTRDDLINAMTFLDPEIDVRRQLEIGFTLLAVAKDVATTAFIKGEPTDECHEREYVDRWHDEAEKVRHYLQTFNHQGYFTFDEASK